MVKMRMLDGLLASLLLLCLVNPCIGDSGLEMAVVFKGDQTEVPFEQDDGNITMRKPRAFRVPAFVGGVFDNKDFLVLLCDARYNGFSDWSFIEAAAKTSYGDYKSWSDVEIFAKNTRKSKTHSVVGDVTAVMKGNKIYALAPSWDESKTSWVAHKSNAGWNPLMIVGTVMNSTDSEGGDVFVKWEEGKSLKSILPKTVLGEKGFQFIGGVGNGVVTKKGAIVFPIQIANTKRKVASSIMYSTNDGSTWQMGGTTEAGPSECSVVEWGDGKLLLNTRYDAGVRKVYESDDMGTTWKKSPVFSRVWGNQPNRKGVGSQGSAITAPVDGKDVLLFTHPLNTKGGYTRDTLQLWMSDGQRIVCVGKISEDGKGERSGYSILAHVGDHLYSMHEINPYGDWKNYDAPLKEWDRVLAISPLPQLFEKVKETVRAWRKLDAELRIKGVPTDALVGFLGESNDGAVWKDRYNCVNAGVNGATRVQGGFRFNATVGSGAQWPVRSQGQNQVYRFTRYQFTIAATVTIHAISETEDISLLGASEDARGDTVVVGIGYTQDKKWCALHGKGVKIPSESSLELEKVYHVAITFENGVSSVYVEGEAIVNGKKFTYSTASINHFYMGGIGKSAATKGSLSTVENVMLFKRALNETEIAGLSQVDSDEDETAASTRERNGGSDDGSQLVTKGDGSDKEERSGSVTSTSSTKDSSRGTNIPDDSDRAQNDSNVGSDIERESRDDGAVVPLFFGALVPLTYFAIVHAGL